jgi:hypothetical protein
MDKQTAELAFAEGRTTSLKYAAALRITLIAALVAGAWLGVYVLFTHVYPDDTAVGSAYRYRDDGLITLSHARGLADVGTVSVSVSGSRVEGYSAPLQFAAASAFYGLGGDGYRGFLDGQVVITTMLLGASVFALLRLAAPRRALTTTALVTVVVAVALFGTYAFFGWHSSGMENPITNALAAGSVAMLAAAVRRPRLLPAAGIVVAFFALSRVEFAFHALPLLVVAGAFVAARSAAGERWRRLALLGVPAVGLWVAVMAVRVWYFGDLFPNTAEVQEISPVHNVRLWAEVLWPLLVPAGYAAFHGLRHRRLDLSTLARSRFFWVTAAAGVTGAALLARRAFAHDNLPGIDAFVDSSRVLGVWWWAAIVLGLAVLVRPRLGVVEALLVTLVVTGAGHVLVFGPARLHQERVVTFVLVPLVCLAAAFALQLEPRRALVGPGPTAGAVARCAAAAALLVGGVVGGIAAHRAWASRQVLCCDVSRDVERVLAQAASVQRETRLPVASVANADLGLMSLEKQVNITDLGQLGDPLFARVWRRATESGRVDVGVDYLNHYAAPDVVELHGEWSCIYASWSTSDAFRAGYQKVWDDGFTTAWGRTWCPQVDPLEGGIWVRADLGDATNSEVVLSRALAAHPDPAIVRRELAGCRSSVAWSCQYVTRSVLRNLGAFADAGRLGDAVAAFRTSPSAAYDQALLHSRDDGDWYRAAADALFERASG